MMMDRNDGGDRSAARRYAVLLVEDNPADARLCREMLHDDTLASWQIDVVGSLSEAAPVLDGRQHDLVLLDLGLPESKGVETLQRFMDLDSKVPVVVLTGMSDSETGAMALALGAQDYITKGAVYLEYVLPRALRYAIERTALQDELIQHNRLESIAHLISGVAHDFNNILASIVGFTSLAITHIDDAGKAEPYLRRVETAADRARRLIHQLLTFTRGEASADVREFEVTRELGNVLELLKPLLPSTLKMSIRTNDCARSVRVDPTHFHQLLMNLAINAKDATGGEGELVFELLPVGPVGAVCDACGERIDRQMVGIAVNDSGIGVPKEARRRIFEPYVTTKPKGEGTGMGLAVVSGIVHTYGGHVTVGNSCLGHGAAFTVYLPIAAPAGPTVDCDDDASVPKTGRKMASILVAEDEEDVRDMVREVLVDAGHRVDTVCNGADALDRLLANRGSFDLLVTDQTMPELTGTALARELWKNGIVIPVILCTGYSDEIIEASNEGGISRIIGKPYEPNELLGAIEELVRATDGGV